MSDLPQWSLPYRPCAGTMVLNREGLVWMGHRPVRPNDEFPPDQPDRRWQMPQGGIDKGEDPLDAARRELWEETGMRSVELLARMPDRLTYDLPDELVGKALKGKYRGQEQAWFVFRFEGDEDEINITHPPDGSHPEFDRWEWVPMTRIADRIVEFKRPIYETLVEQFRHLTR